jgi:hypothetical protein
MDSPSELVWRVASPWANASAKAWVSVLAWASVSASEMEGVAVGAEPEERMNR